MSLGCVAGRCTSDNASTALQKAGKALDKAASKGVIHKNQAANRKSGMAKQLTSL